MEAFASFLVFALALLAFLATGVPVAVATGLLGMIGTWLFVSSFAVAHIATVAFSTSSYFILTVVPLFIMMGRGAGGDRHRTGFVPRGPAVAQPDPRIARRRHDLRLHRVLLGMRVEPGDRGHHRRDGGSRDGPPRLRPAPRARRDRGRRNAGHPDTALDRDDPLRGDHRDLDRRSVHRRAAARHPDRGIALLDRGVPGPRPPPRSRRGSRSGRRSPSGSSPSRWCSRSSRSPSWSWARSISASPPPPRPARWARPARSASRRSGESSTAKSSAGSSAIRCAPRRCSCCC